LEAVERFLRAWAGCETSGQAEVKLAQKIEREIVGKFAVLHGMENTLKMQRLLRRPEQSP